MNATTIIGWTQDGGAFCPEHKPAGAVRGGDLPSPVFASDAAQFEDGGLSCEASTGIGGTGFVCGAVIIESDTCRTCDKSLRDDHDSYAFGPAELALTHVDNVCRPHLAHTVLVRERYAPTRVAVHHEIVPGDIPAALDAIVAAYAGRVATFDVIETEEVTVYA